MLREAILSTLPIVVVRTRDIVNFAMTAEFITKKKLLPWPKQDKSFAKPMKGIRYYVLGSQLPKMEWKSWYETFQEAEATLVIVNPEAVIPEAFDAGDLVTPKALVREVLSKSFYPNGPTDSDTQYLEGLLSALGGLTLKEAVEIMKMTMVDSEQLTADQVTRIRRQVVPSIQGFSAVDTDLPIYHPNPEWDAFVSKKKHLFLSDTVDWRLVPRGALLDGPPGTGKTQAAKYIARQWGVPLYRLDATVDSKWHGESQGNLQSILNQVANEAPCVLLMDEMEKFFAGQDSNGITKKLLSLLLWFMQENRTKVFVVMTTNNKLALPPELYREGRISGTFSFLGLRFADAQAFAIDVAATFNTPVKGAVLKKAIDTLFEAAAKEAGKNLMEVRVAHSKISETVFSIVEEASALTA